MTVPTDEIGCYVVIVCTARNEPPIADCGISSPMRDVPETHVLCHDLLHTVALVLDIDSRMMVCTLVLE